MQQIRKKSVGDDQIDGLKVKLLTGQSLRGETTSGVEVELLKVGTDGKVFSQGSEIGYKSQVDAVQAEVDAEELRAAAAESALASDILAEASARSAADVLLQAEIDQEEIARDAADVLLQSSINSEAISRAGADDALQAEIDAEEVRALAAESLLSGRIDFITSNVSGTALDSLTEIVTAFQNADSNLNGAISALATDLDNRVDAEEAARIAGDASLTTSLNIEIAARIAADSAIQSEVDAEENARANADVAILDEVRKAGGWLPLSADSGADVQLTNLQRKVYLTGSGTKNILLPSTAGLQVGAMFEFFYYGSGSVLVKDSTGAVTVATMFNGSKVEVVATATGAETWILASVTGVRTSTFAMNAASRKIINLLDPTANQDAATKKFVDDSIAAIPAVDLSPYLEHDGSVDLTGDLKPSVTGVTSLGSVSKQFANVYSNLVTLDNPVIGASVILPAITKYFNVGSSDKAFSSVYASNFTSDGLNGFFVDGSGLITVGSTGPVDFQLAKISNVGTPTVNGDAANKLYVDTAITNSSQTFNKQSITLSVTDITNGYVDLAEEVLGNSLVAFVGRLGIHLGEDYSLSVEGGVTRVTFGALIGATVEAPAAGEKMFFTYAN